MQTYKVCACPEHGMALMEQADAAEKRRSKAEAPLHLKGVGTA